jgi:hypothetical protein
MDVDLIQIVELATVIAARSRMVIDRSEPLSPDALFRYGSRSLARIRGWRERIDAFPREVSSLLPELRESAWARVEPVLFDVLTSDLITRLWGAILTANDARNRRSQAGPVGSSVFRSHLYVRQSVMSLLANAPMFVADRAARVDRVRRRIERWCDVLLGPLVLEFHCTEYVFQPARSAEFGREFLTTPEGVRRDQLWELYRLSLFAFFRDLPGVENMARNLRQEILQSIIECFPLDPDNAADRLPASWISRLRSCSLLGMESQQPDAVPGRVASPPSASIAAAQSPVVEKTPSISPETTRDADGIRPGSPLPDAPKRKRGGWGGRLSGLDLPPHF